jgi:hypothetical protein
VSPCLRRVDSDSFGTRLIIFWTKFGSKSALLNMDFLKLYKKFKVLMGCPAFGVSVSFLKQPALPGEAFKKIKIINKKSQLNQK